MARVPSEYSSIAAMHASSESETASFSRCLASFEKNPLAAFIQDAEIGDNVRRVFAPNLSATWSKKARNFGERCRSTFRPTPLPVAMSRAASRKVLPFRL